MTLHIQCTSIIQGIYCTHDNITYTVYINHSGNLLYARQHYIYSVHQSFKEFIVRTTTLHIQCTSIIQGIYCTHDNITYTVYINHSGNLSYARQHYIYSVHQSFREFIVRTTTLHIQCTSIIQGIYRTHDNITYTVYINHSGNLLYARQHYIYSVHQSFREFIVRTTTLHIQCTSIIQGIYCTHDNITYTVYINHSGNLSYARQHYIYSVHQSFREFIVRTTTLHIQCTSIIQGIYCTHDNITYTIYIQY